MACNEQGSTLRWVKKYSYWFLYQSS